MIRYRWNGTGFAVDSISRSRAHRTSYDCGRGTKEVERAVCHVGSLAALDLELARAYRCVIYKMWVECLDGAYRERIAELNGTSP